MNKYYFARIGDNDFVEEIQIVPGGVCLDKDGVFSEYLAKLFCINTYGQGEWIQTYPDANSRPELRYNYAGVGHKYDREKDAFYTVDIVLEEDTGNYLNDLFQWVMYPVMYLAEEDRPGYGFVWYPEFPEIEELVPDDPSQG